MRRQRQTSGSACPRGRGQSETRAPIFTVLRMLQRPPEASPRPVALRLECEPLHGSSVDQPARLTFSPSHLQLTVSERRPPPWARSGHRKGGALLLELSPSVKASPQVGGLFPHNKGFHSGENPSICSPSRYPTMTSRPPCSQRRFALSLPRRPCAHPPSAARHHGFLIAVLAGSKWR